MTKQEAIARLKQLNAAKKTASQDSEPGFVRIYVPENSTLTGKRGVTQDRQIIDDVLDKVQAAKNENYLKELNTRQNILDAITANEIGYNGKTVMNSLARKAKSPKQQPVKNREGQRVDIGKFYNPGQMQREAIAAEDLANWDAWDSIDPQFAKNVEENPLLTYRYLNVLMPMLGEFLTKRHNLDDRNRKKVNGYLRAASDYIMGKDFKRKNKENENISNDDMTEFASLLGGGYTPAQLRQVGIDLSNVEPVIKPQEVDEKTIVGFTHQKPIEEQLLDNFASTGGITTPNTKKGNEKKIPNTFKLDNLKAWMLKLIGNYLKTYNAGVGKTKSALDSEKNRISRKAINGFADKLMRPSKVMYDFVQNGGLENTFEPAGLENFNKDAMQEIWTAATADGGKEQDIRNALHALGMEWREAARKSGAIGEDSISPKSVEDFYKKRKEAEELVIKWLGDYYGLKRKQATGEEESGWNEPIDISTKKLADVVSNIGSLSDAIQSAYKFVDPNNEDALESDEDREKTRQSIRGYIKNFNEERKAADALVEQIREFVNKDPEKYVGFDTVLQYYTDSMAEDEEAVSSIAENIGGDNADAADKIIEQNEKAESEPEETTSAQVGYERSEGDEKAVQEALNAIKEGQQQAEERTQKRNNLIQGKSTSQTAQKKKVLVKKKQPESFSEQFPGMKMGMNRKVSLNSEAEKERAGNQHIDFGDGTLPEPAKGIAYQSFLYDPTQETRRKGDTPSDERIKNIIRGISNEIFD